MKYKNGVGIRDSAFVYYNFFKIAIKCRTSEKYTGITRQQIFFLLLVYSHLKDEEIILSVLSRYNMSKVLRRYYILRCSRWICKVRRDHYCFTAAGLELVEYFVKEYEKRASKPFTWS